MTLRADWRPPSCAGPSSAWPSLASPASASARSDRRSGGPLAPVRLRAGDRRAPGGTRASTRSAASLDGSEGDPDRTSSLSPRCERHVERSGGRRVGAAVQHDEAACSALLVAAAGGSLGELSRPGRAAIPVLVKANGSAKSWRVLVDKDTRGAPEIFALALKKSGATLVGQTGGDPVATEVAALPDGSGFTLNLGAYKGGSK